MKAGVPGGSLHTHDEKYFYFHHSNGKLFSSYRGVPEGSLHTHDEKYFYFHHSNGKWYG